MAEGKTSLGHPQKTTRSYKIQLPTVQRFTRIRHHLRPDRRTTADDNEPDQMADREPRVHVNLPMRAILLEDYDTIS